ncbi:MAG: hydrogenase maturation protease [Chloroflexota bacterium]
MMKTLILGMGNPILSDDGVGIYVARALADLDHPGTTVMEAGVAGLELLDLLTGYDRAIIIDAIQTKEGRIGQIYRLMPQGLDTTRHAAAPHDVNFATALELGKRLGLAMPREITIFAIEAGDVSTFSEKCSPEVEQAIPVCVEKVVEVLSGN